MNKKGFTLAEVLISLAIIGVVAAITIPALYNSNQYQTLVSKLASSVSSLENAFSAMLIEEGANGLEATEFATLMTAQTPNYNRASGVLGEYLKNSGISLKTYAIKNLNGTAANITALPAIVMKNGSWVMLRNFNVAHSTSITDAIIRDNGGSLYQQFAEVIIDVNGDQAPNINGRDIFYYILGDDGILYPMGGKDERIFITGTFTDNDRNNIDTVCSTSGQTAYGITCAARLMLNGNKIDY